MPNTLSGYSQAQDDAYGLQDRFRKDLARTQAGTALSGGNFDAASNSLFGAGMLNEGVALQDKVLAREDAETARGYEAENRTIQADERKQKDEQARKKEGLAFMVDATEMLQKIAAKGGPEEMLKAFDSLAPVFAQMTTPEVIAQYREAIAKNPSILQAIGQKAANELKVFNTSSGVVAVDTDALSRDMKDPNAVRTLYQDPYRADKAEADLDYKRAQTVRALRPPAPRNGAAAPAPVGAAIGAALPGGWTVRR